MKEEPERDEERKDDEAFLDIWREWCAGPASARSVKRRSPGC
jgi:hypothetical protein